MDNNVENTNMENNTINNSNIDNSNIKNQNIEFIDLENEIISKKLEDSTLVINGKNIFTSSLVEKIMAFAIWPIAFIYVSYLYSFGTDYKIYLGIFTLLFLITSEVMFFNRKRTWESILFLILSLIGIASTVFPVGTVWAEGSTAFFTHLFAVYSVLCRSERLAEDKTSHLFLWDGITGFFVMPFKNFPLNIRTIVNTFGSGKKKGNAKKFWTVFIALVVGIILFFIALNFLKSSDDNYKELMDKIGDVLTIKWDIDLIFKLMFTPFFAMYFYGLFGGCFRETKPQVQHRGDNIKKFIEFFKKVPNIVWVILIGLFSVFYVVYFVLQGSYLFSAFRMSLPTEFTYSEYARKGFSEMCSVMIINFIVLWLSTRTNDKMTNALKTACSALIVQSMIFALIAFLKLYMYIDAYGFTPLRLQSVWLATVLMFACVCMFISLVSSKKTARIWFTGSATLLGILCLI